MEPYLDQCKKRKYRQSLTAIRISAHRLEIETERYRKVGEYKCREERLCKLCESDGIKVIGDEEHVILVCPSFQIPRQKTMAFLDSVYPNFTKLNNYNKMLFILTCEGDGAAQVSKLAHAVLTYPRYSKKRNGQRVTKTKQKNKTK